MIFHFASSQEIFFLSYEEINFPVTQDVLPLTGFVPPLAMNTHPMCTNIIFPVERTIFLVRDRIVSLSSLGRLVYNLFVTIVRNL